MPIPRAPRRTRQPQPHQGSGDCGSAHARSPRRRAHQAEAHPRREGRAAPRSGLDRWLSGNLSRIPNRQNRARRRSLYAGAMPVGVLAASSQYPTWAQGREQRGVRGAWVYLSDHRPEHISARGFRIAPAISPPLPCFPVEPTFPPTLLAYRPATPGAHNPEKESPCKHDENQPNKNHHEKPNSLGHGPRWLVGHDRGRSMRRIWRG